MRARFHAEPIVRASELLLQERTPRDVAVARPRVEEVPGAQSVRELVQPHTRRFSSPHGATPRTQLLSNGRYAVMLTAAGSGYSRWRDLAITRFREDATSDDSGSWVFLRDVASGERWSAGYQPSGEAPESYDVSFTEDRADFVRRDGAITTRLEVIVSSEDDAEVRRVSFTNHGARTRELEVTSYAEILLAPAAADAAHRAFSNLFVETEAVAERATLLATRRRRAPEEAEIWLAHVLAVEGETIGDLEWETDRAQFLGRGRRRAGRPRADRRRGALEQRRLRARPDRQPPSPGARAPGEDGPRGVLRRWWRRHGAPCSTSRTSTTTSRPSSGSRPSPGRRPRSSCTTSASGPTRRTCSRRSAVLSSTSTGRCAPRPRC